MPVAWVRSWPFPPETEAAAKSTGSAARGFEVSYLCVTQMGDDHAICPSFWITRT